MEKGVTRAYLKHLRATYGDHENISINLAKMTNDPNTPALLRNALTTIALAHRRSTARDLHRSYGMAPAADRDRRLRRRHRVPAITG